VQCPDLALAVPGVRGGGQIVYENSNRATIIFGVTPGFLQTRNVSAAEGPAFSQQDVGSANKVALLGKTVVTNLFGDIDPIGQSIHIKNIPFIVVRVLEPKGQSPIG
jgi:putative ABC transport system permease protein